MQIQCFFFFFLIKHEAINLLYKFGTVQERVDGGDWEFETAGSLTRGLRRKSVPSENIICQWANTHYARPGTPIHYQHRVPDG